MATVLFDNGVHKCIVFDDILSGDVRGTDIQANQFLIIHNGEGLLYDPGGVRFLIPFIKGFQNLLNLRG